MTLEFTVTDVRPHEIDADAVVIGVFEEQQPTRAAEDIDAASGGALKKLMASGDASGKVGAVTKLFALPGVKTPRVVVVGLGEKAKLDLGRFHKALGEAARAVKTGPTRRVASYLAEIDVPGVSATERLRASALLTDQQAYRYVTTLKSKNGGGVESLLLASGSDEAALWEASAIAEGMRFARELGNLPPNICTPAYVAEQAHEIAGKFDHITVEVLERAEMRALGMGSLLAVAAGSGHTPRLVVANYRNGGDAKPYVLVGKGITFDSGGISIKPSPSMEEMKFDMMGAASVLGTLVAVAKLELPINLVVIVPAVENMPDGSSYRPGDVLTSMSGQTIEVVNTDAEGRLILCDALTYARRFEPQAIVDVATLTGACVVALGKHAHGLFTKHDDLANELNAAGDRTLDRAWRLPLWDDYQSQLDSVFADMANIGGKGAGAITAACFLARFTEGLRWAHLDIAGTSWDEGRKGLANGRPVPLLTQWLIDRAG